jgi:hypothetical protein
MVRNSATPAKGGLESICVLVIERLPQLGPICFGAGLCSGAELHSLLRLFLKTNENRTPTGNDAIVHLEKLNRSVLRYRSNASRYLGIDLSHGCSNLRAQFV